VFRGFGLYEPLEPSAAVVSRVVMIVSMAKRTWLERTLQEDSRHVVAEAEQRWSLADFYAFHGKRGRTKLSTCLVGCVSVADTVTADLPVCSWAALDNSSDTTPGLR
jgi:hypothetical protein